MLDEVLLVVFDLEHTGHGPYTSDIIQISARAAPLRASGRQLLPASSGTFNVFCGTTQGISYIMQEKPGFAELFTQSRLRERYAHVV